VRWCEVDLPFLALDDAQRLASGWNATASLGPDWYNDHVSIQMTATEVKAKILSLLDVVAAGEEIEITKHGRPVARLVPAKGPQSLKGKLTGAAMSAADDEELFTTGAAWNLS
jgi:prevent-host-death family protein